VTITTDASGSNDYIWITTLCQVLLLNLGESPFFANYGLPAKPSIVQQVAPDYYVARTQQQFSQYFANLVIARDSTAADPTYRVNVTTNQGTKVAVNVPI
jgi:hypothetical protein